MIEQKEKLFDLIVDKYSMKYIKGKIGHLDHNQFYLQLKDAKMNVNVFTTSILSIKFLLGTLTSTMKMMRLLE